MRDEMRRNITDILTRRRDRRIWRKLMIVLVCVVVCCVAYALSLPARTLGKTPNCGKQEHTHTEDCYQNPVDAEVLTCRLEAHTHNAECFGTVQNAPLSAEADAAATPKPLDGYIKDAHLFYRVPPDTNWTPAEGTALPGDAELKLDFSYDNVRVDDLKNAGCQLTYTLPSIMRDATGSGPIKDASGNQIGTMTVENGVVTLKFDETKLPTEENAVINGTVQVESKINLTEASKDPAPQITVGDVTIDLKFEPNIIAKHANVEIQKGTPTAIQDASGDYLEYTLTVTAGKDGAPNVVVKDHFTDKSQILGYVDVPAATPAGALSMDGETMVWTVGDMAPNEIRTLTYRVKLKPGYLGGAVPTDPVVNTAELFCGGIDRGKDTGTFTPKAAATMSKVAGDFVPDSDGSGGGTITYTVWIRADETNTYTLTNVKIWDALDGSIGNRNATDQKYREYLSYVVDSFRLYDGGHNGQNGDIGLTPEGGIQVTPVFQEKKDGTTNPYYISCDAGTLKPGQSKTLIYKVHVGPGVFPAAGNEAPTIENRAQIHAGDRTLGNETALNSWDRDVKIDKKEWSTKHSGVEQTTDTEVSISGSVFEPNGNPIATPPAEFTAPAGSYQYTVTVNEKGDWDVSNASLKDQLQGDYSKYIGYVRVDAYNVDASDNRTLQKTVWLAVDGLKEFTFTPRDLGLTGVQSYDLTYYTQVTIPDGVPLVNVENKFIMTGDVGIGNLEYNLTGAYVTASNTVLGTNSFSVSKHSWYYEPSQVPEFDPNTGKKNPYAYGAICWYIQVDGTVIPAGTHLQDRTFYVPESIYDDSLVGIYKGKMGDRSISSYDDLEELQASGKLTRLEESSYDTPVISSYKENGRTFPTMTVRLKESIELSPGESLFLIIKMEPSSDPADLTGTEHNTYKNEVQSSYNGENWVEWEAKPTMVLYGSNGISKELEKVSSWDGTTETVVIPEGETVTPEALTGQKSGTYVSWKVQLNYTGRLHGDYYVEELIPDGLELAYVECTGIGKGYTDAEKPSCAQKSPGDGWTPYEREGVITTYYYTQGQTARWYVEGLKTDANPTNPTHTIDFRVVCRVTDGDVLLGGQEKTFQNQVNLCRENGENGKVIDSSSSPVTLTLQTMSKEGIVHSEENITQVPFVITVNPLGEDLVPGTETISLVDTLGDTLKLDLSSIQVKETGTDTKVEGWEAAVNGQTLTLTLPDEMPLTITYSAWIIAKPGDRISISNNAHWEGYSAPPGGAWGQDNFEFKVSASAGFEVSPSIQITKRDENHVTTVLQGAKFTLTQAVEQGGQIEETADIKWEGTTGANGVLTFGDASTQKMEYNTIYCLKETTAPDGYVLDDTPHYFVIAKKVKAADGTEAYPTFPENVHVHYSSPEYSYEALNHKGQITVQKKFTDSGGHAFGPVLGTYTFGLYDSENPQGDPIQTVTITYSAEDKEATKTAVFRDLPLDKSYYVFELDDAGKPVLEGGAFSGRFTVSYQYLRDATLTAQNGEQTVTVTNQVRTPKMPEAGGIGTRVFYVVGWILLAGAAVLLLEKKRMSPKT